MKLFIAFCFFATTSMTSFAQSQKIKIGIEAVLHKASEDCEHKLSVCKVKVTVSFKTLPLGTLIDATLDGSLLTFELKEDLNNNPSFNGEDLSNLIIARGEEFTFDDQTAAAFGRNSLTILEGTYRVDYSTNRFGTITLNVR